MSEDISSLGFSLIEDFINIHEENILLNNLKKTEKGKGKGRNTIQRFGSSAPYKGNMVSNIIPPYFDFILNKIVENNLLEIKPNSITINEYHIGQEITPHIDSKSSGDVITILSLLSPATMVLTHRLIKHKIEVPARSLIQMRNEIRNVWKHAIEPVKSLRYSLVFRHGSK